MSADLCYKVYFDVSDNNVDGQDKYNYYDEVDDNDDDYYNVCDSDEEQIKLIKKSKLKLFIANYNSKSHNELF